MIRQLKHPFGFLNGERVVPAQVEDGETIECPADGCGKRLHVRGPYAEGTVRHFWHPGHDGVGGSDRSGGVHRNGGESPTHKNYKSHAASALLNFFGGFVEERTAKEVFEQRIRISEAGGYRQGDAVVTFESPHSTYGKGIIIEVQHENKNKDIDAVTKDYLSEGYSVYWTDSETHYEPGGYLFDRDQLEREIVSAWPNAVPESADWTGYGEYPFHIIHPRADRSDLGYNPSLTSAAFVFNDVEFDRPHRITNVQLPREFYEDRARDAFRETLWHELFPGYEWDARTTLPTPDNGAKRNEHVDAVLPHEWAGPPEDEEFRDTPWEKIFPGNEYPVEQFGSEGTAPATFRSGWVLPLFRDELIESLDARDVPNPGQQWHVTKRCLKNSCLPGEHEWIDLTDGYHWRECRKCGLNDSTWFALYPPTDGENARRGVSA